MSHNHIMGQCLNKPHWFMSKLINKIIMSMYFMCASHKFLEVYNYYYYYYYFLY